MGEIPLSATYSAVFVCVLWGQFTKSLDFLSVFTQCQWNPIQDMHQNLKKLHRFLCKYIEFNFRFRHYISTRFLINFIETSYKIYERSFFSFMTFSCFPAYALLRSVDFSALLWKKCIGNRRLRGTMSSLGGGHSFSLRGRTSISSKLSLQDNENRRPQAARSAISGLRKQLVPNPINPQDWSPR